MCIYSEQIYWGRGWRTRGGGREDRGRKRGLDKEEREREKRNGGEKVNGWGGGGGG